MCARVQAFLDSGKARGVSAMRLARALRCMRPHTAACPGQAGLSSRASSNGPPAAKARATVVGFADQNRSRQGPSRSAKRAIIKGLHGLKDVPESKARRRTGRQRTASAKKDQAVDKDVQSIHNPASLLSAAYAVDSKLFKNQQPISVGVRRRVPRRTGCAERHGWGFEVLWTLNAH
jgi:hypothetical protein